MANHWKDVLLNMPILALLPTITLMILEYICKLLKLKPLIWLYWELLDRPNIAYIIRKITKPKHENLAFFMLDNSRADVISKIMIFINNIEDV